MSKQFLIVLGIMFGLFLLIMGVNYVNSLKLSQNTRASGQDRYGLEFYRLKDQRLATPSALPDLTIQNITASSTANPSEYMISVIVKNQGASVAKDFNLYGYIDPSEYPPTPQTPETFATFSANLNPGELFTYTYTDSLSEGTHNIYTWVDRDNKVVESREDNNTKDCQASIENGAITMKCFTKIFLPIINKKTSINCIPPMTSPPVSQNTDNNIADLPVCTPPPDLPDRPITPPNL